jgi:hypothetical protein
LCIRTGVQEEKAVLYVEIAEDAHRSGLEDKNQISGIT